MRLVDDVDAALAAHDAIIAMARAQRLQGVTNLHRSTSQRENGDTNTQKQGHPKPATLNGVSSLVKSCRKLCAAAVSVNHHRRRSGNKHLRQLIELYKRTHAAFRNRMVGTTGIEPVTPTMSR